jgi:hypothetical protein
MIVVSVVLLCDILNICVNKSWKSNVIHLKSCGSLILIIISHFSVLSYSALLLEYVLSDVGAVFEWTESVYRQTAEQAFRVTEEIVVPYLVHRR